MRVDDVIISMAGKNVSQANAKFIIHHDHLAVGNQGAIHQHVQRLAGQAVKLDHRTLVQLQQITDGDHGIADFHRDGHRDVHDHVEIWRSF
jgi:hypothetical protein